MFLYILLLPLLLLACFILPILGTIYTKQTPQKWVTYWLLVIASRWTILPLFGLFVECQGQMFVKIIFSLALIFILNKDQVQKVNTSVDSILDVIVEQKVSAQKRVGDIAKQYNLVQ